MIVIVGSCSRVLLAFEIWEKKMLRYCFLNCLGDLKCLI